jgi:gliding motility-associated-like protein
LDKLSRILILFISSFLYFQTTLFAQLEAGTNDTINPGVPVNLTAVYGEIGIGVDFPVDHEDYIAGPFPIGFPFSFFGDIHQEFYIGTNGWISFTYNVYWAGTREAFAVPSIATGNPKDCILGPFQDMDSRGTGGPYVYYQTIGDAPNRKLVVMFCQMPMFRCTDSVITFQVVLNEGSNTIENHILHKPSCPDYFQNKATLGVQNKDGFIGYAVPGRNATSWTALREGWLYTPITLDSFRIASIPYDLQPVMPGEKIEFHWYDGSDLIANTPGVTVTPSQSTIYRVEVTLCNGETYKDSVMVVVVPYIPNAFTPNNDGLNDRFIILGIPYEQITHFNLQIYDRWGQMIYTSTDIRQGWDGTRNGTLCQEGVYVWIIYYEDNKKKPVTNKGTIMLLR